MVILFEIRFKKYILKNEIKLKCIYKLKYIILGSKLQNI